MLRTRKLNCLILLIFMLCMVQRTYAAHIVGGEVTYECLGNDNYRFTLQIYRDCASGGARFDSAPNSGTEGTVTIFNGAQIFTRTLILDSPIINPIPPNIENPCLVIPQGVCVERGTYTFDVNLPQSPSTYTITYSRCCRNSTINNILLPGDTGATYTIDLTPGLQLVLSFYWRGYRWLWK